MVLNFDFAYGRRLLVFEATTEEQMEKETILYFETSFRNPRQTCGIGKEQQLDRSGNICGWCWVLIAEVNKEADGDYSDSDIDSVGDH